MPLVISVELATTCQFGNTIALGVFVGWQVGLARGFGDGFDAAFKKDKAP